MAAFGVGGLLVTLILATFGSTIRSGRLGMVALLCALFFVTLFSQTSLPWIAALLFATVGLFMMTFRVNNNTLVLTLAPDGLRGRVMSLYQVDHALTPLASSALGVCADIFSTSVAVMVSGILGLLVLALLITTTEEVRNL
jgi:MFS family permease